MGCRQIRPWPAGASWRRRLGDPPLAGDAFVNQRLAVGGERGDLGLDARNNLLRFGKLDVQIIADGFLLIVGRLKRSQVGGFHLVENWQCRCRRDARNHVFVNLELVGEVAALHPMIADDADKLLIA